MGRRKWRKTENHNITSDFIVLMVEEVSKLNIVRKLEEIST